MIYSSVLIGLIGSDVGQIGSQNESVKQLVQYILRKVYYGETYLLYLYDNQRKHPIPSCQDRVSSLRSILFVWGVGHLILNKYE
jgi:hypothetical protein